MTRLGYVARTFLREEKGRKKGGGGMGGEGREAKVDDVTGVWRRRGLKLVSNLTATSAIVERGGLAFFKLRYSEFFLISFLNQKINTVPCFILKKRS